jgi:hypothetical protein
MYAAWYAGYLGLLVYTMYAAWHAGYLGLLVYTMHAAWHTFLHAFQGGGSEDDSRFTVVISLSIL